MTSERDTSQQPPLSVREEAADWFLLLQQKPDDQVLHTRFGIWLSQSDLHRLAWRETNSMWQALGDASGQYSRLSSPSDQASALSSPVVTSRGHKRRWVAAASAGALSLCLSWFALPTVMLHVQADHITTTAESRAVTLEDGSTVVLAADSAIKSRFSDGRREITLLAGEAFFDVQREVSRPFIVDAEGVKVEVLGTVFDVRMTSETTNVALAKGQVRASSGDNTNILAPGEIVSIDRKTGAMTKDAIGIEDIGSWREGRLYVTDVSIGSVIELLRRYHPAWIAVADPGLAAEKVTGIYDLTHPDQALRALVDPHGGKVRAVSSALRVVSRY